MDKEGRRIAQSPHRAHRQR